MFCYKFAFTFSHTQQGINGLDGENGAPGRPGEKGSKGDVGHPGIDVFQTVKVRTLQFHPPLLIFIQLMDNLKLCTLLTKQCLRHFSLDLFTKSYVKTFMFMFRD